MARNYVKLWMGKSTLGAQTIYNIDLEQSDVVQKTSGYDTTQIIPVWISIDKGIIQNLLSQVGKANSAASANLLDVIFAWPFPENPIVTYISPRQRNNRRGWNKDLS